MLIMSYIEKLNGQKGVKRAGEFYEMNQESQTKYFCITF